MITFYSVDVKDWFRGIIKTIQRMILAIINKYPITKITSTLSVNWVIKMTPIFKCLICKKDIERSTKTFWKKKGHLLCSTCLDNLGKIEKNPN